MLSGLLASFSFHEILLYIILIVLAYLLVRLFFYHSIEVKVRKESRCIREQNQGESGGLYSVTAVTSQNKNLYTITYDTDAKSYNASCACPEGKTLNQFQNIPIYDQRNPQNPIQNDYSMNCYCDKAYDVDVASSKTQVYYAGYPGLQRFMRNKDTTFFDLSGSG